MLAKCTICGAKKRGTTRKDVLNKIRKHVWKEHRNSMIRRIKKGKLDKKNKDNPHNKEPELWEKIIERGFGGGPLPYILSSPERRERAIKLFMDLVRLIG